MVSVFFSWWVISVSFWESQWENSSPREFGICIAVLCPLTSLMSLMSFQGHWWMKIIWKYHIMHQVLLTCTYIFWAKSRDIVRLPSTYLITRVLNFVTFLRLFFCQIAKLNTPEIINILFSQNLILAKCKTFLIKTNSSRKDFG